MWRSADVTRPLVASGARGYRPLMPLREEVLRRLLISRRFLETSALLTPDSDAAAIGSAILAAHDAAELALNAIASHHDVRIGERTTMFEVMDAIDSTEGLPPLSGRPRITRLNAARKVLKHSGVFPDPQHFYRIVDQIYDVVNEWCTSHLEGLTLDQIDLAVLIEDAEVRRLHREARELFENGRYREALEAIGHALFFVMRRSSGRMLFHGLYGISTQDALAAAAYGVRPSDLLNLGRFLPNVTERDEAIEIEWDTRELGHEGNWHSEAVAYCLAVFVDVAVKLQHVRPPPRAWEFVIIFEDVIKARVDDVEVWRDRVEGPFGRVVGKVVLRTLHQGEELCGQLSVKKGFAAVLQAGSEEVLEFSFKDEDGFQFGKVLKSQVEVSYRPKDSPGVRGVVPHLFEEEDTAT